MSPLDERILVYMLVVLTTLAAFGYFSIVLRKLSGYLKGCKWNLHLMGIFIAGLSMVL